MRYPKDGKCRFTQSVIIFRVFKEVCQSLVSSITQQFKTMNDRCFFFQVLCVHWTRYSRIYIVRFTQAAKVIEYSFQFLIGFQSRLENQQEYQCQNPMNLHLYQELFISF